jgi:hypothetical protein
MFPVDKGGSGTTSAVPTASRLNPMRPTTAILGS